MNGPKEIPVNDFNYILPEERIAKYPLEKRDHSKLLVFKKGQLSHNYFYTIEQILENKTHLVFNDSRVIHARLKFQKASGAFIEIFCLEPDEPYDYQQSFTQTGRVRWKCLAGNSKKWKTEILYSESNGLRLSANRISKEGKTEIIEFTWEPEAFSFSRIVEIFGKTPIPPYLNRDAEEKDSFSYQTVYARAEGSVAAPTAGLHFTEELLDKLGESGIKMSYLTLHVGAGTFTPVRVENGLDHKMHIERFFIDRELITRLLSTSGHITSVGTTSCRTLESLYWLGIKLMQNKIKASEGFFLDQFESYSLNSSISREDSLEAVLKYMEKNELAFISGSTGIMISPGYSFKMVDSLITNFHQPASTLLMLISAFTGEKWRDIYAYALKNDFRFLSYGDSSILFRE